MPVDAKMQEVLDAFHALGALPVEHLSPTEARQLPTIANAARVVINRHLLSRAATPVPEPIATVEHCLIRGGGGELLARIYRPERGVALPLLLYFHGGGWVMGSLDAYDDSCRALANAAPCIVMSVAYRQAPEHPFPAAPDDALAAYQWLCANAGRLGGDAGRIAIGGESAGGNLAAGLALRVRDEALPQPVHQLLIYPVLQRAFDTRSYREHAHAKPLGRDAMRWYWGHYLVPGSDGEDPLAAPLLAPDLRGLPPATVILAESDPLQSEGIAYAQRLHDANVQVEARTFDGVTHEFFGMVALLPQAREALELAATRLHKAFGAPAHAPMAQTPPFG